jgi:poly(3-hydroxyalkanoate) synthetase
VVCADNDLTSTRRLIAEGIIQVLVGKPESDEENVKRANEVLDTAEAWISQRAREVSRLWYADQRTPIFTGWG